MRGECNLIEDEPDKVTPVEKKRKIQISSADRR